MVNMEPAILEFLRGFFGAKGSDGDVNPDQDKTGADTHTYSPFQRVGHVSSMNALAESLCENGISSLAEYYQKLAESARRLIQRKKEYYTSFREAVEKYIDKYNLHGYSIEELAAMIDRYKKGPYAVSVGNRLMPYRSDMKVYGQIGIKGENYDVRLNSILAKFSKYSETARDFLAFSLIHELMHALRESDIKKYPMALMEGLANMTAYEYFKKYRPNSKLAKAMKAVYEFGDFSKQVVDYARGLIVPYARETHNIYRAMKKVESGVKNAYGAITGRYKNPSMNGRMAMRPSYQAMA